MNNLNEYPNLKKWCETHYENTKIRVYPQTVPMQTIIDQVLGRLELAEAALAVFCAQAQTDTTKVKEMEGRVKTAEKKIEQKRRVVIRKEVTK